METIVCVVNKVDMLVHQSILLSHPFWDIPIYGNLIYIYIYVHIHIYIYSYYYNLRLQLPRTSPKSRHPRTLLLLPEARDGGAHRGGWARAQGPAATSHDPHQRV